MLRIRIVASAFALVLLAGPRGLSAATTYLQIDGDTQRTPNHAMALQYQTDANVSDAVRLSVYQISRERYIAASSGRAFSENDFAGWPTVAQAQSKRPVSENAWLREIDVPALPIGQYALVARVENATSVSTLNVTTIGLASASAGNGSVVYMPTDLRTFESIPSASLAIEEAAEAKTIPLQGGLARLPNLPAAPRNVIGRAADGSIAVIAPGGTRLQDGASVQTGIFQTDRPVYRPGDTIGLRAILRTGSMEAYGIPAGPLHLHVQSPDGTTVADRDLPVSPFGTVSASVRLPADAPTGYYQATVGALQRPILVAAYKKPEYEIAFAPHPEHVVGGETLRLAVVARYFFGRPAAGMTVHYTERTQPRFYWRWWGPYAQFLRGHGFRPDNGERIAEGQTTTDASGRATFAIATKTVKADSDVGIVVDARDTSGRTVSLSGSVLVTPASLQVWATPDNWFGTVGQTITLRAQSKGYDNKPVPAVPITIVAHASHWSEHGEVDDGATTLAATTDANGNAAVAWTPQRAGEYRFDITAKDQAGRTASSQTYLWVTSSDESWLAPVEQPMLVADKDTVPARGAAQFLLAIPHPNRDVMLVTTTDRIVDARIVHVRGTSMQLSVAVPRGVASFGVSSLLPTENGVEESVARVTVADPDRRLRVLVVPRKARYEPGERATFDVRAIDASGRPQRAEFGLGVVDQAIYAVQSADDADPVQTFYGGSAALYASGTWFRPNLIGSENRASSDMYSVSAAPSAQKTIATVQTRAAGSLVTAQAVRSEFLDTAYWSPAVVTGADGRATVSFAWPDNLTTWRAVGLGVTADGDVGRGHGDALVTKDFMVRLETPRFLRSGDASTITGIAHGLATAPRIALKLEAGSLSPLQGLDLRASLDANQTASALWPVKNSGVGATELTLSGSDGIRTDAMRMPLPLLAATAAEHVRDAGDAARRASFALAIPAGYLPGDVHLTLEPSLIAELVESQRLLDVYPYYCVEQTMSAGLPAVYIGRVLHATNLKMPGDVDTSAILRHAVARLGQLQHGDGSWGWWEHDDANPFMTAYALYGLSEFRKDGAVVPQNMFGRGIDSLVRQLQKSNGDTLAFWGGTQAGSEWNTRAFMLFALADAAPDRVDRALLGETRSHAEELNPYALSVLGLAEHALGEDAAARRLLSELDRRAIDDGTFRRWQGDTWHYRWEDDPIETTAYALRFEVAMGVDRARVDRTVNFLRSQRRGSWWYTTKDTAAAIYALSEALPKRASEFSPDETVRVLLDGRVVRELHVTSAILDAADASVVIPASQVHAGSVVRFDRSGSGALYWSSDAVRYVPAHASVAADSATPLLARLFAAPPDLAVARTYTIRHTGPWRVGDEVTVELTVRASRDIQFVAVEDPLPAGAEHVTEQGNAGDDAWSGLQILDDRAVFFADRLGPDSPLTISYTLRVTTPGRYTAPAPSAYAMYGPPVTALGRGQAVAVEP